MGKFRFLRIAQLLSKTPNGNSIADDCYAWPVGISDQGKIPDNQMTASSELNIATLAAYGRLNGNRGNGWCGHSGDDWLQVDLGKMVDVCAIATQGRRFRQPRVTAFKLSYSTDGNNWTPYKDANGAELVRSVSVFG